MYQEIVLSPLAFQDLEACTNREIYNILAQLETETILIDNNESILFEIDEAIENISNPKFKNMFQMFIADINLIEGGVRTKKTKTVLQKKRSIKEIKKLRTELDLLRDNSTCKILFTNKSLFKEHLSLSSHYGFNIFILESYITTNEIHILRIQNEQIEKTPNNIFDFINWIKKFIIDAKTIEIRDAYLANDFTIKDIIKILKFAMPDTSVRLITYDDKTRKKYYIHSNNELDKIKTKISKLKEKLPNIRIDYELIKDREKLSERLLLTDRFSINLGHSLGAVKQSDNTVLKQFNINVTPMEGH